jgi:hypothetical protein
MANTILPTHIPQWPSLAFTAGCFDMISPREPLKAACLVYSLFIHIMHYVKNPDYVPPVPFHISLLDAPKKLTGPRSNRHNSTTRYTIVP